MLRMFQPSYLLEIQIWLVQDIPDSSCLKGRIATQIDEMTLQDSQEMNYDSKLQNMSGFATTCEHDVPDKHDHIVVL